MEKQTVTAFFPGIGKVEISKERAEQIRNLQKIIRDNNEEKLKAKIEPNIKNNKL